MANKDNLLTKSADIYCRYFVGYAMATQGRKRAEQITGRQLDSKGAIALASEVMYDSASGIINDALKLSDGVPRATARKDALDVDDDIAAYAVLAVDLAFERYTPRLQALGELSVATLSLRPCILKQTNKILLIRRSRKDKIHPLHFTGSALHEDYENYANTSLTTLIRETNLPAYLER